MSQIFKPLETAGQDGVIMSTGAGVRYRNHPLLACFSGSHSVEFLSTHHSSRASQVIIQSKLLLRPPKLVNALSVVSHTMSSVSMETTSASVISRKSLLHTHWQMTIPSLLYKHVLMQASSLCTIHSGYFHMPTYSGQSRQMFSTSCYKAS